MSVFMTGAGKAAPTVNYVEWIESTGAQYIKTGVYPTQSTRIEIEASDWSTSETSTALYGTQSASNDRYDLFVTTGGAYRTYYGGGWVGFDGGVDITDKSTIIRSGAVLTIDGVSVTNVEKTFTCTTELYLFAHNTNGSVSKQAALKLYSCKIYDGDILLRDLRPCYDPDGVACLYDRVSKTYYYNAGSGAFIAGGIPEKLVNFVEWIESSGSQYVDLGVSGSLPLRAEIDARTLGGTASADSVLLGSSDGTNFTLLVYWFNGRWHLDVGQGNGTTSGSLADNTRYSVDVAATTSAQSLKVNGDTIVQKTVSATGSTRNLFLFARNNAGTPSAYAKARIYSLKMYSGGVLLRDLRPCYDPDGVACLYDRVSKTYFYNAGSGAFTAGGAA